MVEVIVAARSVGYRIETFDISNIKYRTFDVSEYRTCFALHPLVSPCVLCSTAQNLRSIKYRNRIDY